MMYRRRGGFLSQLPPEKRRNAIILFAIIFSVLFAVAAIITATTIYHKTTYCTEETKGVITKVSYHSAKYGGDYAYVEYRVKGTAYTLKAKKNIGDLNGDTVTVHYNPEDPSDAYMGNSPVNKFYVIGSAVFYAVFMIAFISTLRKKE